VTITIEKIYDELKGIKREIHYIRTHMIDSDTVLTPQEEVELNESLKDLERNNTSSLEDIKRDREDV